MKERPILMNAFSVRAILDGRKTQTRRVIKPQPPADSRAKPWTWDIDGTNPCYALGWRDDGDLCMAAICPYGQPGDRLWVRETRWINGGYVATDPPNFANDGKTPSIFMPRWASRILLEITGVRTERVQDISEDDCYAEGVLNACTQLSPWSEFVDLWDSINAKRGYSWESNPWVWVLAFRVCDKEN